MTEQKYTHWSKEEEELLLKLLKDGYTIKEIAVELGRSKGSTQGRYNYFKARGIIDFPTPGIISMLTKAQKEEVIRLRKEKRLSYRKIADIVGCSDGSASRIFREHSSTKDELAISTLNWTKEEDLQLRRLVNNDVPNSVISERMGRSVYAIKKRRNELKIGYYRKPKSTRKHQPMFKPSGNPWLDLATMEQQE